MCKISKFTINSQENSEKIQFSAVKNFKMEATTDAMCLPSHGGLLLLQQEEERLARSEGQVFDSFEKDQSPVPLISLL